MLPSRCLIFGSGSTLLEGMYEGLFNHLKHEVVFSINDNIKFINSTAALFGDWVVYRDRYELFKKYPLVIGKYDTHIGHHIEGATPCPSHKELILLNACGKYNSYQGLKTGLYTPELTGAFTLHLAICLGFQEIYLCGFDNVAVNGQTHWYYNVKDAGWFKDFEGTPYTGVGKDENGNYKTSFYNNSDEHINKIWQPFTQENIKIFNVSLPSRINVFQKISYKSLLRTIDDGSEINQNEVRQEIRLKLQPYNKNEEK